MTAFSSPEVFNAKIAKEREESDSDLCVLRIVLRAFALKSEISDHQLSEDRA
jgi:hypothetical protein